MLSFNIKSIYSTLQYLIDLDNWKYPEKLNAVIDRLIAPLVKEEKLPELYVPKICSNLRQLLLAIVQNNHLVIVLGVEWSKKLDHILCHYCHICNIFIMKDEEFENHMITHHCIPPTCTFDPFSPAFINLLTKQAVKEYRDMCPHEEFYKTRYVIVHSFIRSFTLSLTLENSLTHS